MRAWWRGLSTGQRATCTVVGWTVGVLVAWVGLAVLNAIVYYARNPEQLLFD